MSKITFQNWWVASTCSNPFETNSQELLSSLSLQRCFSALLSQPLPLQSFPPFMPHPSHRVSFPPKTKEKTPHQKHHSNQANDPVHPWASNPSPLNVTSVRPIDRLRSFLQLRGRVTLAIGAERGRAEPGGRGTCVCMCVHVLGCQSPAGAGGTVLWTYTRCGGRKNRQYNLRLKGSWLNKYPCE